MTTDQNAFAAVADVAGARSRGWRLMAEACCPPEEQWVSRLRDRSWLHDMRGAIGWLGDAADPMTRSLAAVDGWVSATDETSAVEALRDGWPKVSAVRECVERMTALADLVDEESAAWRRGRLEQARSLRVHEAEVIDEHLVPVLPRWCVSTAASPSPVYAALARLMSSWLSVESGRDFDSSLFPGPRPDER